MDILAELFFPIVPSPSLELAAMSCRRWLVRWRASMAAAYRTQYQHYIRQQTTTVDYKRLING